MLCHRLLDRPVYGIGQNNGQLSEHENQHGRRKAEGHEFICKGKSHNRGKNNALGNIHTLNPCGKNKGLYGAFLTLLPEEKNGNCNGKQYRRANIAKVLAQKAQDREQGGKGNF